MKKISAIILLLLIQSCIDAQSTSTNKIADQKITHTNPLVGTWRLIEFSNLDTLTGKWEYRYGKNPKGYFTYTKTNIVNLNIPTDSPLKISEDSAKKYPINLSQNIH